MQAPSLLPLQPLPPAPPQTAALSQEGEQMLLQFFAVKDTPSSEEIRFLARQVGDAFNPARLTSNSTLAAVAIGAASVHGPCCSLAGGH